MSNFADRVAARAVEVKPLRAVLSVLAAPFYVLGIIVGVALVACRWFGAAVMVGVEDVRRRSRPPRGDI